ncbi:serine aminopeptidase domain-containing protein [Sporosarcina sp. CAU 1771]
MIIQEELWGHIPLLHIIEEDLKNQDVPVVIFLHGFTSAKEHNLHYAYNLAKKGVRVLLPDAHLHGARHENLDEVELSLRFWEIISTSMEEVAILRDELIRRKLSTSQKIAVGGTSMGGITTLGCLRIYEWIDVAAVMMGSPSFVELAKGQISQFERRGFKLPVTEVEKKQLLDNLAQFDLTKKPASLNQRPLYFWHGKSDTVVPYEPTHNFYKSIKEDYSDVPNRLVFVSDEEAGHTVSRNGMKGAVNWIASQLKE